MYNTFFLVLFCFARIGIFFCCLKKMLCPLWKKMKMFSFCWQHLSKWKKMKKNYYYYMHMYVTCVCYYYQIFCFWMNEMNENNVCVCVCLVLFVSLSLSMCVCVLHNVWFIHSFIRLVGWQNSCFFLRNKTKIIIFVLFLFVCLFDNNHYTMQLHAWWWLKFNIFNVEFFSFLIFKVFFLIV